jgi:hypothetical protein
MTHNQRFVCSWESKTWPRASGMYQRAHLKCNFMQTHNKKQTATCRRGQGRIQTHPTPQSRSWSSKIRDRTCVTRPSELRERKMVTMLCVLQSSSVCTHTHTHTHTHTESERERNTDIHTQRERERHTCTNMCWGYISEVLRPIGKQGDDAEPYPVRIRDRCRSWTRTTTPCLPKG